jgi:hypothetical protein
LRRCDFGERWYNWIAHCISSVCFFVLMNGSSYGLFNSSRGLRQKDPLYSLLFVIFIEALSKMITITVNMDFLFGFSVGCRNGGGLNISQLLFADGTLMFYGASPNYLHLLHCLFLCFEAVSSLRINLAKSELVHVGNVNDVEDLAGILGCGVSSLPLNYLGLSLRASYKAKSIWDGIIEKIECHLAKLEAVVLI